MNDTPMNNTPTKNLPDLISDYRLERFALDEVSQTEGEQIRKALHANNQDPDQIKAEILASNTEILAQYPPAMIAARIQDRLQKNQIQKTQQTTKTHLKSPRTLTTLFSATALATVLLAVFVLPTNTSTVISTNSPPAHQNHAQQPEPGIRYKGLAPSLQVWRQTPNQNTPNNAEQLENNARTTAGDLLQLRFQTAGAPHGVIVSIDGRNHTTLHFPDFENADTTIPQGASTLNHSYQLDDAPDFERFFLITSQNPIDTTAILDTLEQFSQNTDASTSPLPLSDDLSSTDFLVIKE